MRFRDETLSAFTFLVASSCRAQEHNGKEPTLSQNCTQRDVPRRAAFFMAATAYFVTTVPTWRSCALVGKRLSFSK